MESHGRDSVRSIVRIISSVENCEQVVSICVIENIINSCGNLEGAVVIPSIRNVCLDVIAVKIGVFPEHSKLESRA